MSLERMKQNRFLVLGRAGLDLYADPPGTEIENAIQFVAALGGSAANIAAGIARLGGSAGLITCVSDDAVGRYTRNQLRHYAIDTSHVHNVGGEPRNSLAVVETRHENCQSVIYRNNAADFALTEAHVAQIDFSSCGALIVTGTSLAMQPSRAACLRAMRNARLAGAPVVIDVDYRPYSWASAELATATCLEAAGMSDVVIGNDTEFSVLAGGGDGLQLANVLAQGSATIVVYKMGEHGAVTFSNGKQIKSGIFPVTALKPTGAGDAFMAGFVTGLAAGLDLPTSVKRGSAAAAIVVTRVGCAPAMPDEAELKSFISKHAMNN